MRMLFKSALAMFMVLGLSCKDANRQTYKPVSIGAINSLAVVIDNELWKGEVGDKIREHFAAPYVGLPQDEPLFTIQQLPPQVFSGSIRNTRSVLFVERGESQAQIQDDMYALPQKIGVIKGKDVNEIVANIDAKADMFIKSFKGLEVGEAQKRFLKSLSKEKVLQDHFGISLNIPSAYKTGKEEPNFVWIDRQIPKGNMNLIVYTLPQGTFKNDSTLVRDIVKVRDSIGALYIPGPELEGKITYMRTEPAYAPSVMPTEINGMKAVEVRGIWDILNYAMTGPFVSYIINDKENDRLLVLEGFTFAPATEKRDSMFELEAIMKTLRMAPEKAEIGE